MTRTFSVFIALIFLLAAFAPVASAQEPGLPSINWDTKTPRWKNYSSEDGLSQSVVNAMLQDQSGFMWFGTQDGLNRFDGNEFRIFKHDPDDPASLGANYIQALYEDEKGNLWIGTIGGGLNKFDPRAEKFTRYVNDPDNSSSISVNSVSAICPSRDGTLWLGTNGGGVNHFDPATGKAKVYHLNDDAVLEVIEDRDGMIWVGLFTGGLARLDPTTGKIVYFTHDDNDPSSIGDGFVQALMLDRENNLWIGNNLNGLNRFVRETGTFEHFPALPDGNVQTIYEDRAGTIWIGTGLNGLIRFNAKTKRFVVYQHNDSDPSSLSVSNVQAIYQDRAGVLWVGTAGVGVDRYDPYADKFMRVQNVPNDPNSLINNMVWAIREDRRGNLWVGTNNGLTRFAKNGATRQYANDPSNPNSLAQNSVFAMFESRDGTMWFGTGVGLSRYDAQADNFENLSINGGQFPVFNFAEDKDGALWFGTSGSGLVRYDPISKRFQAFRHDPSNPKSLAEDSVISLYRDKRGALWAGTFANGLCRMDSIGEFACWNSDPNDPSSLGNGTAMSFFEDSRGDFWVATGGGGLNKMDRATGKFTQLREKDGLANDFVYSILEDESANLWVVTNNGVSRYNPVTGAIRNFTKQDGLQANEFNQNATFQSADGKIYLGGIIGFNVFYPKDIVESRYIPPIALTRFSLFSEAMGIGGASPLDQSIQTTDSITLNYDQDFFSFDFAALHFSAPERIHYAYKMDGLEEDWNYVGNRRYASYTSVPPGDYTFRVKAANSDGIWGDNEIALRVIIIPPFWQTWWFRVLIAAVIASSVVAVFEIRTRTIRAQKRALEVKVEERTRELREAMIELQKSKNAAEAASRAKSAFLANVSHELRTPLNAILGFSQLIIRSAKSLDEPNAISKDQLENVEVINKSGEHLLGLINDVLEMSKIEAGRATVHEQTFDLHRMLQGIEEMFRFRAEEKGLAFDVDYSLGLPQYVRADEGKLRQILMNMLGNAFKFTEEGGIGINVTPVLPSESLSLSSSLAKANESNDEFRLPLRVTVTDTGYGISATELETLFKPFAQSSSAQKVQEGTGLGLSISRQFAELMGGTLNAQSAIGKGSVFTLEIPVTVASALSVMEARPERRVIALEAGQETTRALIVDDKAVNRALLVKLLSPLGFDVREAENGKVALQIWDEWNPHVVLMDMRMPIMDGYEATRRIKATTKGQATVILAVTASALEEERAFILSEGCDDYIRKPFREHEIFDALERHLGLKFIYDEEHPREETKPRFRAAAGFADQLAVLSPDLRDRLRKAIVLGDANVIETCIRAVEAEELRETLSDLAQNYEYEKILNLLQAANKRE